MTSAVIVSTARTPLAKSWKGAFNMTHGATLGGHAVQHAISRAGIDAAEVDDVIIGCANPEGATGANIARQIALRAGCPVTVSGMTVNRFCSSGLQAIALASQRIIAGEADIFVAGGVESISCVQQEMNTHMLREDWLAKNKPEIYWNMLQTAEQVAKRYEISRDRMDEYGAASQQRATAALAAGLFEAEIAPITVTAGIADKVMGLMTKQVTVSQDEGIRAGTTKEGISGLRSALPGGLISAGNASQFSDGGGAVVVPPPRSVPVAEGRPPTRRPRRWLPRYTWSGTLAAVLFGCSALTPSLLPRGWLLQGIVAGITAAIGYGVAWLVHGQRD